MGMNNQSQVGSAAPQFSNAQMRSYFTKERYPRNMVIGMILLSAVSICSFAFNLYFAIFGVAAAVCLISYAVLRANAIPTDEQYDAWLEEHSRAMVPRGRRKLNLDRSQLIRKPLRVRSFVLPGSQPSAHFREQDVYMKKGKDGNWRFSVNVFTYFFATEDYFAVYTCSVNALNQAAPPFEETEEYFYNHIVGVTTFTTQDSAVIKGVQYLYRIQKFSMRIVNGDDIDLGAYIRATALENSQDAPAIIPPTMNIDRVLAELRAILRDNR